MNKAKKFGFHFIPISDILQQRIELIYDSWG
jgi:hypothetical protein